MKENKEYIGTKLSTGELVQMELEARAQITQKEEEKKTK